MLRGAQGTLKKIYIDNSGRKPQDRHAHLFNDAIIYSSKLIGPYKYKVRCPHLLATSFAASHSSRQTAVVELGLRGAACSS